MISMNFIISRDVFQRFAYFMKGKTMGTLLVSKVDISGQSRIELWKKDGQPASPGYWHFGTARFQTNYDFQVNRIFSRKSHIDNLNKHRCIQEVLRRGDRLPLERVPW